MCKRLCLIVAAVVLFSSAGQAQTLYVDDDGPPGGLGESWETSCRFLQDALLIAFVYGHTEIRVAQGTYRPDRNEGNPGGSGNREATFSLTNLTGVSVLGGYAGLGAPDPDARDIDAHPTILSGDLLGNDGPDFANNDENAYHVVTSWYLDGTTALDGFTISGGNANGPWPHGDGAGMLNQESDPTVANCTFSGNAAYTGGGMFNAICSPAVASCSFVGNEAGFGAGMVNYGSSTTLTGCWFGDNRADFNGGGMYNDGGSPVVTGCTFSGNISQGDGGGGIYGEYSSPTVSACTFSSNVAAGSGGGGGLLNLEGGDPVVTDCSFDGNEAYQGGAMANGSDGATVTDCSFSNNTASGQGGGLFNWGTATVTNCSFRENSAPGGGGGIYGSLIGNPPPVLSVTGGTFCGDTPDHLRGAVTLHGEIQMRASCPVPGCPGDLNGDDEVGIADFLAMLARWGACP